uniref:Uncharacterized protein n=1 Tax=Melopsittacus undulatus TaxID=13146 RepID=A0A8V5HBE3_MELUD
PPSPHRSHPAPRQTWLCVSGQRVEVVLPFLGQCRLDVGRCCQTCTPMSWVRASQSSRSDPEVFRGWLVRRVCGLLTVCSWRIPIDIHGELPPSPAAGGETEAGNGVTGGGGFFPPCFSCRICHWALLKLLSRLFLSVQLHRGQLETVLRAQGTPHVPLVFLSTHKSHLDGPLLSFILCSRGLGVPRVTVGAQPCSPRLRSLLRRLGGVFLPAGMEQAQSHAEDALPEAVLAAYMEELLRSQEPLLIFLEEPAVPQLLSASARRWLALVLSSVCAGTVPDVLLVPVGIGYDIIPGGSQPCGAQPLGIGACLWAVVRALRRNLGCVRVDFGQPFSLQVGQWGWSIGMRVWAELPASLPMAAAFPTLLLILLFLQGVFLSRLLQDFAWLLEEILLRQRDVGFSGQLRVLVQHSLILLGDRLRLYHIPPLGDVLVIPEASAHTWMELGQHSADILPVFASEAVGGEEGGGIGGAVPQPPPLLPLPQPCQPLGCWSEDIVDKLILCGLLEPEQVCAPPLVRGSPRGFNQHQAQAWMDFSDSESQDESRPYRCFKVPLGGGGPRYHPYGVRVMELSSHCPLCSSGSPRALPTSCSSSAGSSAPFWAHTPELWLTWGRAAGPNPVRAPPWGGGTAPVPPNPCWALGCWALTPISPHRGSLCGGAAPLPDQGGLW